MSSADDTEDLDVENMWCRLVAVRPEPISDVFGAGAPDEHLSKAGCVNHQHRPNPTLLVEDSQHFDTPDGRRPPAGALQPMFYTRPAARRTASARSNSGTLTPASAARRASLAYTSS